MKGLHRKRFERKRGLSGCNADDSVMGKVTVKRRLYINMTEAPRDDCNGSLSSLIRCRAVNSVFSLKLTSETNSY